MRTRSRAHIGPFLLELIIIILFLAIAGAVCMRIFAKTYLVGRESADITHAVAKSRNIAELFAASSGPDAFLESLSLRPEDDSAVIYFDSGWSPTEKGAGVYRLELDISGDPLVTMRITVRREDQSQPIYQIDVKKYYRPYEWHG